MNKMNLPELIIKNNLKEGDEVNCVSYFYSCYSTGIKILVKKGDWLGFCEDGAFWKGNAGVFELPEPVNKFVRSKCKNTAENQQALFALGYRWASGVQKVSFLDQANLTTKEDGLLYAFTTQEKHPELYEFTTTAKLKPEKKPEIERIKSEIKALKKQLNKLKESKIK
jgi:hypothetical protein